VHKHVEITYFAEFLLAYIEVPYYCRALHGVESVDENKRLIYKNMTEGIASWGTVSGGDSLGKNAQELKDETGYIFKK
jgi:hypothetical protein